MREEIQSAESVTMRIHGLRTVLANEAAQAREEAAGALQKLGAIWDDRLARDWRPPSASGGYPWKMIKPTLAALIPGLKSAPGWLACATPYNRASPTVCALILAGNTPLMAWSPISACLLSGDSVFVKMSNSDVLWPRLFCESLAEVAPRVADRIELDVWHGGDPQTAELVRAAGAVIAFGNNPTLEKLRTLTPIQTPFFGYGHSISVAIWTSTDDPGGFDAWFAKLRDLAYSIARDTLLFGQAGCLSPQALFVDVNDPNPHLLPLLKSILVDAFTDVVAELDVRPVSDVGVATAVRQARAAAEFTDADVYGSDDLSWTLIGHPMPVKLSQCPGHAVLTLIPFREWSNLPDLFGNYRGRISSIGVAGRLLPELRAIFEKDGVSRICRVGEMQTPPLDWKNGGFDLLSSLTSIEHESSTSPAAPSFGGAIG